MKRIVTVASAVALSLALAGCGGSGAASSAASEAASSESASAAAASVSAASESATAASASTAATSASAASTTAWTEVKTAAEAAKGAGFDTFGAIEDATIDDLSFSNPTFSYADGVAQATYETGATAIFLRKADGTHSAPLTDRDKTEFPQTWTKSYEGLDVTLYGQAKGAATVFTWADGTKNFAVTYQGLGGEEMSMDSDEVAEIVKDVKAAEGGSSASAAKSEASKEASSEQAASDQAADEQDSDEQSDDQQSDQSDQSAQNTQNAADSQDDDDQNHMTVSENDVRDMIASAGAGTVNDMYQVQFRDGTWHWQVSATDANGNERDYYVSNEGDVDEITSETTKDDPNSGSSLTTDKVEEMLESNGWGYVSSMSEVQKDGKWYWEATCEDSDGKNTYLIDSDGNVYDKNGTSDSDSSTTEESGVDYGEDDSDQG